MMAINKTLATFIGLDLLFLACAALHLTIPLITRNSISQAPSVDSIATLLLLDQCPLTAAMVDAGIMFVAFVISLPPLLLRRNIVLLQIHAALVCVCALFTLAIGLVIWYSTLETKQNIEPLWNAQTPFVQSMLQFKFQCCGYASDALFVKDATCTDAATAANLGTCAEPFSAFANQLLDIVFTTFFGFCAVDGLLLLGVLCVIKERKEQKRYRFIDEKKQFGGI